MKPEVLKLKLETFSSGIIDSVIDSKLMNITAKFFIKQNLWRLDNIFNNFIDKNGEIDTVLLSNMIEESLFVDGRYTLELRSILPQDIKNLLPDKIIIFTKEDLEKILK
mgnify:FL=1